MLIDCNSCEVRGPACGDCVVTALLGGPPGELDDAESAALEVLAGSGLVPPLRLVLPLEVLPRAGPEDVPVRRHA
ncbi:MAG: hypothetical protein LH461_07785 [Spirochaetaceae bacterium]|nr:hypothetical protein [Spirochaetaceae bacterium]